MGTKTGMRLIDTVICALADGVRHWAVERESLCCPELPDARDGVIVAVPSIAQMAKDPLLRKTIMLVALNDHQGVACQMSMDRESCRQLVNVLVPAIAESERRESRVTSVMRFAD